MKFFYAIMFVNILVVIGVIGFVIWQFFDSGNPMGLIILAVIAIGFLGFFIYIGVPGMIVRAYIKSTGESARAVIQERRMGNLTMYSGGGEYETGKLTSQQVILKLEVHPNNGATYVAEDRFWAPPSVITNLTPGKQMQVAIARNNPKRVVSLTETLTALPDAHVQPTHGGTDNEEILSHLRRGNKLAAIKAHRTIYGSGFEEGKAAIEEIQARLGL